MPDFCHLHCHTQYSLLDGAADIYSLMKKAKADDMKAVAITDHGNMFGAFKFYSAAKANDILPIIGCEFYIVEDRFQKEFTGGRKDKRYHQLLLAKDANGYKNLSKLCSLGFIEGAYGNFPRIDKQLLMQYKDGLIATSCCVAAEVPRTFLEKGEEAAEKVFLEWLDIFGEDYYVELQRHGLQGIDQDGVNVFMMKMARKHNVKMIATNDSHYVEKEDYNAHDILLCINTGDFKSTPIGDGKGYRFGFENDQFYFKSKAEMAELFKDVPEALDNTMEIVSKITAPQLKRDILLPNYTLPQGFNNEDEYLKHLAFEGAKRKYPEVNSEVAERLEFELKVIKDMGFSGYFLIVQDFIAAAKQIGVAVGPGRGSAAGSAVAFATGITNLDPIKYSLLFERFLNPERVSMPDIDIDFDDEGRQKVIDYVVDKYGKNQVAQIITYGTMAAKSSIRDVARVLQYPLADTDKLAKMIPDGVGMNLKKAFEENPELKTIRHQVDTMPGLVLREAEKLEGSIRQRGIHAAGVIIAPSDITEYIPVCTAKDADLLVTQFDGKVIEDAGMLKMDFLGLKTLSIINDALKNVKENRGIDIDIDKIPLDDELTFELYQRGDTIGTFQFESEGMRMYLKDLKPTNIEDLIAMNALYRPGPMDYIPDFINRKHGKVPVEYPHEWLEPILKNTYGIMVYQEQIMQAAQIMAGYSLGSADILRRAMGKKIASEMEKQKVIFVKGATEKGVDKKKAEEIFDVMAKFANYGFNRSHSAAYSILAYQTGYLKAHYPAEYMAAVLTHNMNDIKQVTFFLSESNRMGILTLGPDVNESQKKFTVNEAGEIRFALSAIKGVGDAAVEGLVEERVAGGPFISIFDITKRVNLRSVNKKCLENLALAGAFDSFGLNRSQYFHDEGDGSYLIEKAVKFGNQFQNQKATAVHSLFGESLMTEAVDDPPIPDCKPWTLIEKLEKEKEVTGMYISGHPLDQYELELKNFCTPISELDNYKGRDVKIGGIVTSCMIRVDKKGRKFALFSVEDMTGSTGLALFAEDYLKYRHMVEEIGTIIYLKGKYQPRYKSEDQFELRISGIELLSEVREKYAKGLIVNLHLSDISEKLIKNLEEAIKNNQGDYGLKFKVVDNTEKVDIEFSAKTNKINLSNELIKVLKKNEIHYSII